MAPGTVALQARLSMEFSSQEYWSGLPCSPAGDLPNPGIESMSLAFPALTGRFIITQLPGKPLFNSLQSPQFECSETPEY